MSRTIIKCKVCGQVITGGRYYDYDMVQFHAWKFHPDIVDSYNPFEVRDILTRTGYNSSEETITEKEQ